IEQVVRLILSTKHVSPSDDPDIRALQDLDLSILGQPEPVFDEYEDQIRKEYEWVPDEMFRTARAAILRTFLGWPSTYSTNFFVARYEQQARKNLERSVSRLVDGGAAGS